MTYQNNNVKCPRYAKGRELQVTTSSTKLTDIGISFNGTSTHSLTPEPLSHNLTSSYRLKDEGIKSLGLA